MYYLFIIRPKLRKVYKWTEKTIDIETLRFTDKDVRSLGLLASGQFGTVRHCFLPMMKSSPLYRSN